MGFSADWLALRAGPDAAARDVGLLAALGACLARRPAPLIVELGCGAGALAEALEPWAPPDARWRLVDNDRALLEIAAAAAPDAHLRLVDLNEDVEAAVEGADAVVASAFYDLVSAAWIERLLAATPAEACLYAALSYDGVERWAPAHEDDARVLDALGRHMRRDKGLGVALGPSAAQALAERLRGEGRRVLVAPSPWRLEAPRDRALMSELADGIARAVSELGVDAGPWRARERDRAVIGHLDVFAGPRIAWPADRE